jgi:Tfp pilus assembly protein PilF
VDAAAQAQLREAERLIRAGALERAYTLCTEIHARHPQAAAPHLLVAEICLARKAPTPALRALSKADRFAPPTGRSEAMRAEALFALRRISDAVAAAERAVALDPNDTPTLLRAGATFSSAGKPERALACFRAAASRDPDAAHLPLATQLHVAGAFAEAEVEYRAALDVDRDDPLAWFSITQLRQNALSDRETTELRAALARASNLDDALVLAHAVAKIQEDAGDYEQALATLIGPKHAKRTAVGYSFDAWDQPMFDAAREGPTRSAGEAGATRAIFVIGLPRTGTTLVERILAAHPSVQSVGEVDDFAVAIKGLAPGELRGTYNPETLRAGAAVDAVALGAAYRARLADRGAIAACVVDKMPLNFFYAGLIHRALPDARIICVRRRAGDSCVANFMQFFRSDSIRYFYQFDLADTARYYAAFDALTAHWRSQLPTDRFMELSYERLVADQEGETRRLLDACGLAWDERCLSFHENASAVMTASAAQVRKPLYASSVSRWKRYGAGVKPALDVLQAHGIAIDGPA